MKHAAQPAVGGVVLQSAVPVLLHLDHRRLEGQFEAADLDVAGHGASMFRFDLALAKAWGAVGMGASSRVLMQRANDNPNFFVSLSAPSAGKFLPQTGAVVIKDASGQIIGAVGASGGTGDEDEAICIAGVEAAGLAHG